MQNFILVERDELTNYLDAAIGAAVQKALSKGIEKEPFAAYPEYVTKHDTAARATIYAPE